MIGVVSMANADCSSCHYFRGTGHIGLCRRFPSFQNKSPGDWCGEHTAKQVEIVPLPVVDMQQIDEKQVETPIKRRGRPKKEVQGD